MMYPELEVSFHYRDERRYAVELRFDDPKNQAENFFGPFPVEFDWDRLRPLALDPTEYGAALSAMFFHDARIKQTFASAFASAQDRPLRIRLYLNPATPLLHDVIWETLQDPSSAMGGPLATSERVFLSRFLNSSDFRPVHLRPRGVLRALVAIANPISLGRQRVEDRLLAPIDVEREWERVRTPLGTVGTEKLAEGGKASLRAIAGKLREGFDIFLLVCHGALVNGEPLLWLENEEGGIARVMGIDLALRLKDMQRPPRLVVLASCQSAGVGEQARSDDKGALAALGPKLAEVGIPAVIAMQDSVRMDTSGKFFTAFFQQLMQDGQIDRAMTMGRSAIYPDQPDWWVPVLITRLKRGRLWTEHPSLPVPFKLWDAVVRDIQTSDCTPILGPGVVAPILGAPNEIARRWAERYDFPMAPHERDSLPQVAQYLAYHQSVNFLHSELKEWVRKFILDTYAGKLPEEIRNSPKPPGLKELITRIGRQLRQEDEHDLLRMMADLPFPIYITTNRDNLLLDALQEAGKEPKMDICRWTVFEEEQDDWPPSVFVAEPDYVPTVQKPLVFHLFGNMNYPKTLVIAEDDYFDYLIGVNKNRRNTFGSYERATGREPFPQAITRALSKRGLLLLGFRISDWEFRTLFRSILAQEGRYLMKKKNVSVSVQLEPGDDEFLEPQGARNYIEDYFVPNKLDVYWGSAKDFVEQLLGHWRRAGSPMPTEDDLNR